MKLTISDLLGIEHTAMWNFDALPKKSFRGVSTDSRSVGEGEVFFAIRGENLDGHKYIEAAFRRGAACAVIDRGADVRAYRERPFLVVRDTTEALGSLANVYRKKFSIPILAVAGSNGKTTTKEMIATVLKTRYSVLSTEGNLNNQIGVPKTLFRLQRGHDIAVVEIGTNHFGELAYLCGILEPTHGLITNIGREHLEFFRDLRGVGRAEGELFDAMKSSGIGFVNADDPRVVSQARKLRRKVSYGFSGGRIRGKRLRVGTDGCAAFIVEPRHRGSFTVGLTTPGLHAAANALAASAVGVSFGVSGARIGRALGNFAGVGKRMEVVRAAGVTILNDTYNANPDSVLSAMNTLGRMRTRGKKIVVLGDMLELGPASRREQKAFGRMGFEHLLTYGPQARFIYELARAPFKHHYGRKDILSRKVLELASASDIVLVKGSRGMKMEEVVQYLQDALRGKKR
ncbi:MAG: UDP-N-acetylmuramoyl-tripeptide--D-alanyl-D-alanine ligase [Ignavibacteria bacterium]|nr:MAG: UDP-N-acetylmuramoyl-tripeptide--D-alanyl-D-alanine ligase [Ignavibacteria bacterium]